MTLDYQEVYDKARDYIIEYGWCKGEAEKESGECCIVGAIQRAIYADKWSMRQWSGDALMADAVLGLIPRAQALGYCHPVLFNDSNKTTLGDVLTFLSDKWETLKD